MLFALNGRASGMSNNSEWTWNIPDRNKLIDMGLSFRKSLPADFLDKFCTEFIEEVADEIEYAPESECIGIKMCFVCPYNPNNKTEQMLELNSDSDNSVIETKKICF